jgi:hypothetical protein
MLIFWNAIGAFGNFLLAATKQSHEAMAIHAMLEAILDHSSVD